MKETKIQSGLLVFYQKWKKGINNTLIVTILSIVSLYFSIDNLNVFLISIPFTIISIVMIYGMGINYKKHLESSSMEKEKQLFHSLSIEEKTNYFRQQSKDKKWRFRWRYNRFFNDWEEKIFHSLSIEEKTNYLRKNPDSLISSYVEFYLEDEKIIDSMRDEIKLLKTLIKIENELNKEIDENFYYDINLLNFNEKLNVILDSIKEQDSIKLFLEEKIKFITFYQIFQKWNLLNIEICNNFNGKILKLKESTSKEINSLSELFKIQLNKTLNFKKESLEVIINPNTFQNSVRLHPDRSYIKYIELKDLIKNYLIKNYEKIVGKVDVIKKLQELYHTYKDLTSRFLPYDYLINDKWDYKFYEIKNRPEEIRSDGVFPNDSKKFTITGKEVLKRINLIIDSKSIEETTSEFKKEKEDDLIIHKGEEIKNDNGFNRIHTETGTQEMYRKNGKINGEFKGYDEEGILEIHIENITEKSNGQMIKSGKEIIWWDKEKIKSIVNYKNDKRVGFGISYNYEGWIDQIDYYKNDEDVSWDSDENKKLMLNEIKKHMNNGINVYPVQYIGLCESLGIDTKKFKDDPNLKI